MENGDIGVGVAAEESGAVGGTGVCVDDEGGLVAQSSTTRDEEALGSDRDGECDRGGAVERLDDNGRRSSVGADLVGPVTEGIGGSALDRVGERSERSGVADRAWVGAKADRRDESDADSRSDGQSGEPSGPASSVDATSLEGVLGGMAPGPVGRRGAAAVLRDAVVSDVVVPADHPADGTDGPAAAGRAP